MSPDIMNGVFELCGGFVILLSIFKLHRDKIVRGVSWLQVCFFAAWGAWNLFYYPSLDQWFSFAGGVLVFTTNAIWAGQLIYWHRFEKHRLNYMGAERWS